MIRLARNIRPVMHNAFALSQRHFWGWVVAAFNNVDELRLQKVGPERACAEWLLRNGAAVKWIETGTDEFQKDYNLLPPEELPFRLHIKEIDASDSAIHHLGFPHLKGLKYLERIILHNCIYIENEAVEMLAYAKGTLKYVQISQCGNITCEGLQSLQQLSNLQTLLLFDLPAIRNREECVKILSEKLPRCKIEFPVAPPSEKQQQ